jgi:hypothetical protein
LIAAPVVVAAGAAVVVLALPRDRAPRFGADVQPIFDAKCVTCHPVAYPYLDLRRGRSYDDLVRVPAATRPAFHRVLPGRPELSYLLTHPPDPSLRDLLDQDERKTIVAWIRAGAADD